MTSLRLGALAGALLFILRITASAVFADPAVPLPLAPAGQSTMPVPEDRFWDDRFGQAGDGVGEVYATTIAPDGQLYIGGINSVRRWDGRRWHTIGFGAPPFVSTLAFSGTTLYAGGWFASAGGAIVNGLARWDGASWRGVSGGVTHSDNQASVSQLLTRNGRLYVVGHFDQAGGVPANGLAVWDGTAWSAMDGANAPGAPSAVSALTFAQDMLYASTTYSETGRYKSTVTRWDGQAWTQLGPTFEADSDSRIVSLQWYAGQLYATGRFHIAGETDIAAVVRWDGTRWQGIGTPAKLGGDGDAMVIRSGLLYFGSVARGGERLLLSWNGSTWSRTGPVQAGVKRIRSFAQTASSFYIGGDFEYLYASQGSAQRVNHVAQLLDGEWRPLGSGLAMSFTGTMVAAGDDVYLLDGSQNNRVWNGNYWRMLEQGFQIGQPVSDGRTLFSRRGMEIVRRDTAVWTTIGTANGQIRHIVAGASGLYAAGTFTTIDGVAVTSMARWKGASWHAVGDATVIGSFHTAHVTDGGLYIGGAFSGVGDVRATHIARWDGTAWRPLGAGIPEAGIIAITGSDNDLYVASDNDTNAVIRHWDGAAWRVIVTLPQGTVAALAMLDGELVAAGRFHIVGMSSASWLGRWNGDEWRPLGSGINWDARVLAVSGHNLYVAGDFSNAGGLPSERFAHWNAHRTPVFLPTVLR